MKLPDHCSFNLVSGNKGGCYYQHHHHKQEQSALSLFMVGLLVNVESQYVVVCDDNAKSPAVSTPITTQRGTQLSEEEGSVGKLELKSRSWDHGTELKKDYDQQEDHRWTSFNNENPSCAGLTTCPPRAVLRSDSVSPPHHLSDSRQRRYVKYEELPPLRACFSSYSPECHSQCKQPSIPLSPRKLSIPKPDVGLRGRKVTV